MTTTRIGEKLLLHSEPFPQNMRKEDPPDTFVLVTIIEEKKVPGTFGPGKYTGYRAQGEDGRFYLCNWTLFPDDSMTPCWMWFREMEDSEVKWAVAKRDAAWYDVTQGMGYILFEPVWLSKYAEVVSYCSIHKRLFTREESNCWDCKCEYPPPEIAEDHTWKGWK